MFVLNQPLNKVWLHTNSRFCNPTALYQSRFNGIIKYSLVTELFIIMSSLSRFRDIVKNSVVALIIEIVSYFVEASGLQPCDIVDGANKQTT